MIFPEASSGAFRELTYSDDQHFWLQLRCDVPTGNDIGRPSFKMALYLTPGTAHKPGLEILNIVERNKEKQKAKTTASSCEQIKPSAAKPKHEK